MPSSHRSSLNRNAEVEETFVATFISPQKQGRYNSLLGHPTRRRKFLNRINHNLDFIPNLASRIAANEHTSEGVSRLLNQIGVKDSDFVYVISDTDEMDMRIMQMRQAMAHTLERDVSAIICCGGGKAAYYKPESPQNGYILKVSRE